MLSVIRKGAYMARKRKPIVAVVGRPNVGKSTLFNALAGEMISIVKDTPGITRDRIYADISWLDKNFTLIDTGGIEPDSGDIILSQMRGRSLRQTGWGSAICWTKLYVISLKMQRWKRRMIVRKLRLSENQMSANRPLLTA